jgi:hypothetical protein
MQRACVELITRRGASTGGADREAIEAEDAPAGTLKPVESSMEDAG